MSCSNCFNGCLETTSDQCVKYTGLPITFLDISTGDSLAVVEDKIITYLTTVLDGTGILPTVNTVCTMVSDLMPANPTLTEVLSVLVQVACDLDTRVSDLETEINALEGNYTPDCIAVAADAGTHAVLQAVIDSLCTVIDDLTNLTADVATNYEKKADLNDDIAAYMAGSTSSRYYNRMIPNTAVEYYGSLAYFDPTGAGIANTDWEKIYLCNGQNGTPDKRGFSPVGAIVNAGGGSLDPIVDGLTDNYTTGISYGEALVALTTAQLPSHAHTATGTAAAHSHTVTNGESYLGAGSPLVGGQGANNPGTQTTSTAPALALTISVAPIGSNDAHNNVPPVLACHYIMYIP